VQVAFEESLIWSMILQPILNASTEEACEDKLARSVVDGKLQFKHVCCDMNKYIKH